MCIYIYLYELASKLLVCGNGGNHLGRPVSFCMSGRYRFGVSFLGCPVSFCSGFNISLLIEQPSSLLYNNGNFDPGSYMYMYVYIYIYIYIYRYTHVFPHSLEVKNTRKRACLTPPIHAPIYTLTTSLLSRAQHYEAYPETCPKHSPIQTCFLSRKHPYIYIYIHITLNPKP